MKTKRDDTTKTDTSEKPSQVGVVRGGNSEEREISLKTGKAVADALSGKNCEIKEYDTSPDLGERLQSDDIDLVFLALHGKGGEDGTVQAMLDWRGIPYTGPGAHASALCMDKLRTRQLFDRTEIPAPDWFALRSDEEVLAKKKFNQMVVKPRAEGSSLGMSIVEEDEFVDAVDQAREYDEDVIVEEYVSGYEVTVGVYTDEELSVLPPVGIRPSHEFFDYETKYTKGLTEYDVPAKLSNAETSRLQELTEAVVREAETESLCRVDFIRDEDGHFKLLEINTIPGLTETSLLPKAASEAGTDFDELVWEIVQSSWRNR